MKAYKDIINYLEANKKNSIIFEMALKAINDFQIEPEVVLKHIIIYQNELLITQKKAMGKLK